MHKITTVHSDMCISQHPTLGFHDLTHRTVAVHVRLDLADVSVAKKLGMEALALLFVVIFAHLKWGPGSGEWDFMVVFDGDFVGFYGCLVGSNGI